MLVRRLCHPVILCALALCAAASCKGADGAVGPEGPQGPAGPPGPVGPPGASNRAVISGSFSASGAFTGFLPSAAVAGSTLPAIACYISSDRITWLAVAQTPATATATYCGLTGVGTASPGITIINGPFGWFYYLVAVY